MTTVEFLHDKDAITGDPVKIKALMDYAREQCGDMEVNTALRRLSNSYPRHSSFVVSMMKGKQTKEIAAEEGICCQRVQQIVRRWVSLFRKNLSI